MQFRALLTASCALLVTHAVQFSAFAQDVAASKPASIAIVELFTSEGCSSCPPADALLRQINLKQTNAGQLIVGISEHVTYWNNLGWRDPILCRSSRKDRASMRPACPQRAPTRRRWY
jgi:hypothetical protein